MSEQVLSQDMTFREGKAVFFAKARNGMCYPLGSEKKHVIDGEVVGGGGGPAYFEDHIWSTSLPAYAAGMINQAHFMDPEGYIIDPRCLPVEALRVWPTLDRRSKRLLCLGLINGKDPAEVVKSLPKQASAPPPEPEAAPAILVCPVPGCGQTVEGTADAAVGRAALLTHQRLMHPGWKE